MQYQVQQFKYSMSNYGRILAEFAAIGKSEGTKLNEYQINEALDKIAQVNMNCVQFNRDVAQQLYQQTEKDYSGNVLVKDYIGTIIAGQTVLERHIKECNDRLRQGVRPDQKTEIMDNLQQYTEDYRLLTVPFKIKAGLDASQFAPSNEYNSRMKSSTVSGIFSQEPSNREESTSLKLVLIIALVSFVSEMFMMFVKHHFLSMLVYLTILGIFLLNYFDKYYIKTCLYLTLISVVLDFIWVIAEADPYWNKEGPTQHSNLQPGYLRFTYIITLLLMIGKALQVVLLWRFRNNDEKVHKKVKLVNLRFDLDGRPKNSPIHMIWTGNRAHIDEFA